MLISPTETPAPVGSTWASQAITSERPEEAPMCKEFLAKCQAIPSKQKQAPSQLSCGRENPGSEASQAAAQCFSSCKPHPTSQHLHGRMPCSLAARGSVEPGAHLLFLIPPGSEWPVGYVCSPFPLFLQGSHTGAAQGPWLRTLAQTEPSDSVSL